MYTFSSKLKTFSFILMIIGILGIGYGFLTAPKTIDEVEKILAAEEHGEHHAKAVTHEAKPAEAAPKEAVVQAAAMPTDTLKVKDSIITPAPVVEKVVTKEVKVSEADEHAKHEAHLKHVLQQLQNKPWAALYVACIFFLLVSMGVLAFYGIQQVAQSGWSPVLFRVMQGITAYLPVGSVIFFLFLILCGLHFNHLFPWLDPNIVAEDKIIQNKVGYLNFPFWLIRAAVFLLGWNLYRYLSRKNCLAQDEANDNAFYKKNFNISAMFLVFFIVTESIMSWDWIMSLDPHWFSTLFGWYVFASFFVSGITTICMVTLYLKSKGYLEHVNTSHIHDLAKFMFGISVFWTYLWFSQFMLIWYANIPGL